MNSNLVKQAFLLALGEVGYIALVVTFMSHTKEFFAGQPELLIGITMLTLLVVSASISGALVLGKPILLYLNGEKRTAISLFGAIVGWLFLCVVSLITYLLVH